MDGKKVVIITGAAGGLGQATVVRFLENGWKVIATDIADIRLSHEDLYKYRLDVTAVNDIAAFTAWIAGQKLHVDVLINNAGFYDMYPISESDPEKLKKIFDVNAFGTVNMIRALLPFLEKTKGRVINISSISVRIPWLFQPYQLTKITQEALARAMRQELKLKDISLCTLRPGAIDTPLSKNSIHTGHDLVHSAYKQELHAFLRKAGSKMPRAIPPEKVARKLFNIASAKRARYYYAMHPDLFVGIIGRLPEKIQDFIILRIIKN